ncbi:hypothetical protein ILUMI_03046 [Ignelater luminosus]|uniref:Protein regulator of cytokinesis 1 n=1 Tax=Ignelater luminosus TaxID=2038154 RepID=A0A8K0DCB3_IGNLU|nr:hypothetical protein ILUMI_03046 [Ignelater luminosus]
MSGQCNASNDNDWNQEFLDSMLDITKTSVLKWCELLNQLGMETQARQHWATIFTGVVQETYKEIIQEVANHQNALLDEIENLLKQSAALCKELHLKMPDYGSQQLTLCEERRILKERIQEYEKLLEKKRKEIEKCNSQEIQLCQALGRPTKALTMSPLPDSDVIDEFKNYLESLEFEKYERIAHFSSIKSSILELVKELNYKPSIEFEKMVISCDELNFVVSDSAMTRLNNFYDSLKTQLTDVREEITLLREKIRYLWEKLDEDPKYSNEFIQKHTGNTLDTLEALKKELERCETLRRSNIEVFVKDSRKKLVELWDKCQFTDTQRDFEFFHGDLYTEDLLTLHDIEIQKLERYYSENEKLFTLLEERKNLWEKMATLEKRATQPDRYKNRGGQLLKEEKERNTLSKRIPQIEEQLSQLSQAYETRNGKPFLSWGETIDTIIFHDHARHEEVFLFIYLNCVVYFICFVFRKKKIKLSARKLQREKTITPGKSMMGLTSCVSTQNLLQLASNTGTKRKIATPLLSAKRTRHLAEKNENVPRTAPPKLTINGRSLGPSRYSHERNKRLQRCRKIIRKSMQKKLSKENVSACSTEYDVFEKDIKDKENCRSTIFMDDSENGPLAVPLPVTPRRPLKGTPSASKSRAQSPHNAANKLTTAPSLKLLF